MKAHQVEYEIVGDGIQLVEIELEPYETIIAEAGAMIYMEDGIEYKVKMGDGSDPTQGFIRKLFSARSRLITGESIFLTYFTNRALSKKRVSFAAPYPGTIIPLNLRETSRNLIVQKEGFLCAAYGTKITVHLNKRLVSSLFGGEDFVLQKITGDGKVFLHAGGTIVEKFLENDTLRVDTGCVVAFESSIDFDIEQSGGLKSMIFGGEGIFLASLRGTGKVWLQSMPVRKFIQAISPRGKNVSKGVGT
ncbi:TIGR00266 family protein, partial [Bacteroidota bacterium]